MEAEKVGDNTFVSNLQKNAKEIKGNKSEIFRALNAIIKIISIIVIPLAACLFISQYLSLKDFLETVMRTAGSVVSMIPAGMFLLTSVALAVSVLKLAKKKILSHNMYSIEMLARTDVLCFDKTGTLTDGKMIVEEVIELDSKIDFDELMGCYLSAVGDSNLTADALKAKYTMNSEYGVISTLPFSSARKYSAVEFREVGTFYLGAPEKLLSDNERSEKVFNICSKKAQQGYRTLVLCKYRGSLDEIPEHRKMTAIAIFLIRDHVREEVKDMLKWFSENEVDVKIISGDNPMTVSAIAKVAGVPNYEKFISLDGLSEVQVRHAASEYTVFGRVSPEQKAILVDALKKEGKTVTITGDGVNDILAMKKADCSIAMGNGSDAARSTADIVLLNDNFEVMKDIVAEGRRVVNNIQRSSVLYLMKTFFTIVLTFITISASFFKVPGFAYPFTSSNIMIFELCCVGIASFFLALEPNDKKIKGSFLQNIIARGVPASITLLIAVLTPMILQFIPIFGINETNLVFICSMCFIFGGGFTVLFKICKPFNMYRLTLFVSTLGTAILAIVFLPGSFFGYGLGLEAMNLTTSLIMSIIILVCIATYNSVKKLSKWFLSIRWDV